MAVVERRQEGFHYVIIDFLAYLTDPTRVCPTPADDATAAAWVAESELDRYPIAAGFLPILERARLAYRGRALGLEDVAGQGIDFIPAL